MSWKFLPVLLVGCFRFITAFAVSTITQLYIRELGGTALLVSINATLFWLGVLIFSPLWGGLSDALGRRKIFLVIALSLSSLVLPLFALSGSVSEVLAVRFGLSVLGAGVSPIALAIVSSYSLDQRGRSISFYHTAESIGMMAGMLLAGALLSSLDFKSSYLVLAALSASSAIAALFILEKTKNPKPPNGLKVIPRFDRAFLEKGLIYLYIGISLRMLGLVGVFSLIFVYMVEELGIAPSLMGMVASLNPASQILLLIFFGRLVDRVGRKRIFVLGFLLSAFVPLIFSFANGPGLMLLGYVVLGISYSALASGSTTFVSDVAPPSRSGELLGFLHTSRGLGGIFGPLIAGALASLWGYRVMFFVLAGAVFLGFLIASLKTEESLLK